MAPKPRTFALVAAAVLLLSHARGAASASAQDPVVIIGAGMAGATAAYTLHTYGVPFVIVEATDRAGGRLRRRRVARGGPFVEIGGNWVQGYKKGDEFSDLMVDVVGLRTFVTDFDDVYFYRAGVAVPDRVADPIWERSEKALASLYEFARSARDVNGSILFDMSVESALRVAAGWEPMNGMDNLAMRYSIDYEYAVPASKVSIHELSPYYDPNGEAIQDRFVNDPRGFRYAVTWHLRGAGVKHRSRSGPKLRLRSPVKKVVYDNRRAHVVLKSGETIRAAAVISTIPVGALQEALLYNPTDPHRVIFEPELPLQKRIAISKFDLADYLKIFIKFTTPIFTQKDPLFIVPVECDEGGFLNVHNLNKEGYLPGENMVLVTATDMLSRDLLCENPDKRVGQVLEYVSKAAGRKIDASEVEGIVFPRWHNNPYFKGSYTTRPPSITASDYAAFNASVGALFFAGESHSKDHHGYVQGAWDSGRTTAGHVVNFLYSMR